MYPVLLTRRYLTRKVMPLLASVAVALCTAMVLITWSVMGGFLTMLLDSGRNLIGDVSISWPNTGFAYYEDLIERLESDPMVEAATPMIETFGLVSLPDDRVESVMVKGIDGPGYARVTNFANTLYWRPISTPNPKDTARKDWRLDPDFKRVFQRDLDNGLTLTRSRLDENGRPGPPEPAAVLGIELTRFNIRQPGGWYIPGVPFKQNPDGTRKDLNRLFMPRNGTVTLMAFPLDSKGRAVDVEARVYPVANEFRTGLYELDKNVVLVPLGALQRQLHMNAARRVVPSGQGPGDAGEESFDEPGQELVEDPARVSAVVMRAAGGADVEALKARAREIYSRFAADHPGRVPAAETIPILTWADQNATMIAAVKKETGLVLTLFSFISLTAVMLILAIFWAMVSEKTRDVGVLRALGASRSGVAGIWLAYGTGIGLLGSILGGIIAILIVTNINEIHDWMGRALGLTIWDPKVYYFTRIPNRIIPSRAVIVLVGGVVASIVGALIPAVRAARFDPVRSLRFE